MGSSRQTVLELLKIAREVDVLVRAVVRKRNQATVELARLLVSGGNRGRSNGEHRVGHLRIPRSGNRAKRGRRGSRNRRSGLTMPKMPGVNHLDAVRALQKAGFWILRQGKHIVMTDGTRKVVIPRHNPVNAITMGGIVKDAGLTIDEFRKLL